MKKAAVGFFILLLVQLSIFVAGSIPAEERAALISLYNSTDGDHWYNNNGWKTPPLHTDGFALPGTEETWDGVSLSGDHVSHLSLCALNLSGSIPPELGNFSFLEELWLNKNDLGGSIPAELGNLSHLKYLNLSENQLMGSIPPELGNLTELTELYMSKNQLNGGIPPELGNLTELEWFSMNNNRLSGSIPPQLGNLINLEWLSLSRNQLTGSIPPELGNISHLYGLYLDDNQLSGSIPSQLDNLSNLLDLYLEYNQLSGRIPPELGNLSNLKWLLLKGNQLTGSIPSELGNLSNLFVLSLDENQLSGSIPAELGNLSNLSSLSLDHNHLNGNIPPQLGNLKNLNSLGLSYNQLSGSIPSELGNLRLITLSLEYNQLSGSIPSQLGNIGFLGWLYLNNNQLSGSIPPELGNRSYLYHLDLSYNQLSGSIPSQLGNLGELLSLRLDNNQLSGRIPSELGNLSYLRLLWLHNNQLSGSIPAELGNLSRLYSIDLSWNQLDGSIPSSFINLISIRYFDIGYNCLSASDPTLRAWLNLYDPAWEFHQDQCGQTPVPPVIGLNPTALNFGALDPVQVTGSQTVLIANYGGGTLNWSAAGSAPWLSFNPTAGTDGAVLSVSVNPAGLAVGNYTEIITISDPHASNSPQTVTVHLHVIDPNNDAPPLGDFTTPTDGSTVMGSIPVTGWVLDDIEVVEVKLYIGSSYMGDAVFISGARPDVEAAYPGYPQNDRAGWGYMMLTNFLPDGEVVLTAIAKDTSANETVLGTKTITIDNAHAIQPFGAIDTPTQGGTVSGKGHMNWGWVLTPMPNRIPTDGSTINVWVDGIDIGHPTYNLYREDIAALFPGYMNSSNAGGYFILDTTVYKNGLHTIFWTAADNAGNQAGIGCRFFKILNTGQSASLSGSKEEQAGIPRIPREELARIPLDYIGAVTFRKGFARESIPQTVYPGDNGITSIAIEELERVVIHLGKPAEAENAGNPETGSFTGYQVIGERLAGLPLGSTMDRRRGIFYWTPGPGFIGIYRLVFFNRTGDWQKKIEITISPKN